MVFEVWIDVWVGQEEASACDVLRVGRCGGARASAGASGKRGAGHSQGTYADVERPKQQVG